MRVPYCVYVCVCVLSRVFERACVRPACVRVRVHAPLHLARVLAQVPDACAAVHRRYLGHEHLPE